MCSLGEHSKSIELLGHTPSRINTQGNNMGNTSATLSYLHDHGRKR
jgi:hypothetical protein